MYQKSGFIDSRIDKDFYRPLRADAFLIWHLGLKAQVESFSPFGTIADLKLYDVDGADVGGLQGGLQDRVGRK